MKALFHSGLFTAHDISHQVVRLYYYNQAINDGQLMPLWIGQLAHRFGYPLFMFSYHFPWIIGVMILKLGFNISQTIKALFFISFLGSGITMYLLARSLLRDSISALTSSILYLLAPYHFLIIFVSASMGIAFIFTFLPLLLLGIHLIKKGSRFGIAILALSLAGLILSHIMHLIFVAPLIVLFFCWEYGNAAKKIDFFKKILLSLFIGLLISSFYLLPAIFYSQLTRVNETTSLGELYKRNFINLSQLIYSKWGYSPIINNAKNGEISFQLGAAQWLSFLAILLLILIKRLTKSNLSLGVYLLTAFFISIFLSLDYSKNIWAFLVNIMTLDFPFRLILPAMFISSLFAGLLLQNLSSRTKLILFLLLIAVAVYTNRNHFNVNEYTYLSNETYLDLPTEVTTNTFNEHLPSEANDKLFGKPWKEAFSDDVSFSDTKQTTNLLSFRTYSEKTTSISTGQFYFPGQTLLIDEKVYKFNKDKDGLISFDIPANSHQIEIQYKNTMLIQISKTLTIIGLFSIVLSLINFQRLFKNRVFN